MRRRWLATISLVKSITVGISGASGAIYARRLLVQLEASDEVRQVNLVVSGPGRRVISDELDIAATGDADEMVRELLGRPSIKTTIFHPGDIGATIASGSYPVERHGHHSLLCFDARSAGVGVVPQPAPPRRRCLFERRAQAGSGPARDSAFEHTP